MSRMGTHATICAYPDCEEEILGFAAANEVSPRGIWYCQEHRIAPNRPTVPKRG